MILKKYIDFINEELSNSDIRDYEDEIVGLNNLIAEKFIVKNSKFSTYVKSSYESKRHIEFSNKPMFENSHNVFCEMHTMIVDDKTLEMFNEAVLSTIPFAETYDFDDPARSSSKLFVFSYNLEEFLNSDLAKSIKGINKYQL